MSWNYDGSRIATTCKDKKIRVFDPRSQQMLAVSYTRPSCVDNVIVARCYRRERAMLGTSQVELCTVVSLISSLLQDSVEAVTDNMASGIL